MDWGIFAWCMGLAALGFVTIGAAYCFSCVEEGSGPIPLIAGFVLVLVAVTILAWGFSALRHDAQHCHKVDPKGEWCNGPAF